MPSHTQKILLCIVLFIALFSPSVIADGQDHGTQYEERLVMLDKEAEPLLAVAATDERIILGAGNRLQLLASDENTPSSNGMDVILDRAIHDLVVHNGRAYVLTANHIFVINLQNLSIQQQIGGGGEALILQDEHLLLLNADAGIRQYRVFGDGQLVLVNEFVTMNAVQSAVILPDDTLMVGEVAAGVELFNGQMMSMRLPSISAQHMLLQDEQLFVLDEHRLRVLSAASVGTIEPIGQYAPLHAVQRARAFGNYLLLADAIDGVKVYTRDFTYQHGQVHTPTYDVAVDPSGRWLVASQADQIAIYDAQALPTLALIEVIPVWDTPGHISFSENGIAVVAVSAGGLAMIDLASARVIAGLPFSGPVVHAEPHPSEDIWYTLLGDGQLLTLSFNRSRTEVQTIFSTFDVPGQPTMLYLSDNRLGVAAGRAGAFVFDITDPYEPILHDSIPAARFVSSVAFVDDRFFVQEADILQVFEETARGFSLNSVIEALSSHWLLPVESEVIVGGAAHMLRLQQQSAEWVNVAEYTAPQRFVDMQLWGSRLILTGNGGQVHVLNVDTPSRPRPVTVIETGVNASQSSIQGDTLLILDNPSALYRLALDTKGEVDLEILQQNPSPKQRLSESPNQPNADTTAQLDYGDVRWIGTRDGQLVRQEENMAQVVMQDLGVPILAIAPYDENTLLLSLGEHGLVWLDIADGGIKRRADDLTTLATVVDPSGQWLAAATGACGLAIYDTETLNLFALARSGTVTDVQFLDETSLVAIVGGYRAHYQFSPDASTQSQPSMTIQPLEAPAGILSWESSADACVPVEYEVRINDAVFATITETQFSTANLPLTQYEWQVVAIDAFGNRSTGPTILVENEAAGWLAIAQHYQPLQVQSVASGGTPLVVLGFGAILIVSGLVGLWGLMRFFRFGRVF